MHVSTKMLISLIFAGMINGQSAVGADTPVLSIAVNHLPRLYDQIA